jgi:predicted phosphodiesterase
MIVSFASFPSRHDPPAGGVLVGTSPAELSVLHMEEEDSPSSYHLTVPKNRGTDGGEKYYSPYYHHVTVRDLAPATTYYYKPVVHANRISFEKYHLRRPDGQEEPHLEDQEGERRRLNPPPYDGSERDCPSPDKIRSFTTAPEPGPDASVTFAVVGDLGQFPHSEETMARLIRSRDQIDTVILAGDIAYTSTDHRRWDTFFDFLDDYPVVDHVPMQICPGNHDIDKQDDGQEIFLAYEHRFRMPRVRPPELGVYEGPAGKMNMDAPPYPLPYEWGNAYYAYTYGPARVVMISSYSAMEPGSTQYQWIQSELRAVDRSVTPWVIAVLHTPVYNTFSLHHHDLQIVAAKEHLEPLFVREKVNVVFSGHIHAYLRTTNVALEEVDPSGPVHITVGAGGRKCEAPFANAEPEPWVRVRDATVYGYGVFRIVNRTASVWEWIHTGHADDRTANQLWHSNQTLPSGPSRDRVLMKNQYFR